MSKLQVYLSKSKAGNVQDYEKVLELLSKYNVDIVSWNPLRTYNEREHVKLLKSCDIILVIPPKQGHNNCYVGKGQSFEMSFFNESNVFTIHIEATKRTNSLYTCRIENLKVIDEDWKTNYLYIDLSSTVENFDIDVWRRIGANIGMEIDDYIKIENINRSKNSCTILPTQKTKEEIKKRKPKIMLACSLYI